jgi:hypothetical protein
MAKPIFQDIIPPDKRNIKGIPVPSRRVPEEYREPSRGREEVPIHRIRREQPELEREQVYEREFDRREQARSDFQDHYVREQRGRPQPRRRGFRIGRLLVILILILAVGGITFGIMSRMSGAKVVVMPRQETVSVDAQFVATQSGASGLKFQTVTIAKDGKLPVVATDQELANIKATGIIVIYNNTNTSQMLVGNTRFQTTEGLIFRISQQVTVPARTTENGKIVPGSVEAAVTADAVGAQYNVGFKDFTLPGYKGDPKYEQIFAKSKTQIQGGFSGMRKKVDEKEMQAARDKIRTELKNNLIREIEKDIPTGYVLPTDAYLIEYETLPEAQTNTGIELNERATFHGFIFTKADLAQEIAKKVKGTQTETADLANIDKLVFSLKPGSSAEPWKSETINFNLKGSTTLIAAINVDKLKTDLLGKPKTSFDSILSGYPGIAKADVTIRPFWLSSFPNTRDEIVITVENPTVSP